GEDEQRHYRCPSHAPPSQQVHALLLFALGRFGGSGLTLFAVGGRAFTRRGGGGAPLQVLEDAIEQGAPAVHVGGGAAGQGLAIDEETGGAGDAAAGGLGAIGFDGVEV